MAATVQAHRLYQLADYDGTAQLLPDVLACLHSEVDTGPDECLAGTLSTRHTAVAAYLAAAKLATKLGDIALASVRCISNWPGVPLGKLMMRWQSCTYSKRGGSLGRP